MIRGIRGRILLWLLVATVPLLIVALLSTSIVEDRVAQRVTAELVNYQRLESDRIATEAVRYTIDADRLARASYVELFTDTVQQARLSGNEDLMPTEGGFDPIDPMADEPLAQVAAAIKEAALGAGTSIVEARVVGVDGKMLGQSSDFTWVPRNRQLVAAVIGDGQPAFGSTFEASNGTVRVGLVGPIRNRTGNVVGALLTEVDMVRVVEPLGIHREFGSTSEAILLEGTQGQPRFISPLRFSADRILTSPNSESIEARSLDAPVGFVGEGLDYRGTESVVVGETIDVAGWGLVLRMDADEAFSISRSIRSLVLIGSLLATAALVAGWALLLRPLVLRIGTTADAADRIAAGDYSNRINDAQQDEVGEVARGIDRLAADLEFDIRMRADAERRLRYQATHDELTNIFNRQHMTALIRATLESDVEQSVTLLFLDLDDFKLVNDLWSHSIGDEVLVAVGSRLSRLNSERVFVSRWGGDEFTVVLKNAGAGEVEALANQVRALFDQPINTSVGPHPQACSVGIATAFSGDDLDQLLHDADAKMFDEKQSSRKSRMIEPETARLVETALTDGRMEVHYQPIVKLVSATESRVQGVEALARIRSTDGSLFLPADFLDEVLSHRYACEIDRSIAKVAMRDLADWQRAGLVRPEFTLALNLSPASMRDPGLGAWLTQTVEDAGVSADGVVLELSQEAEDLSPEVWAELHAAGFGFAIDDLGLKRSNFDRLLGGGVAIAKLDRRWLEHPIVLDAMVSTCAEHGLAVVAVGVETMDQLVTVFSHGVRMCQGFAIARPQSASRIVELLAQRSA